MKPTKTLLITVDTGPWLNLLDDKGYAEVVGPSPTDLPQSSVGNKLNNKIADYDALSTHWGQRRDVFVTLDTYDYFARVKRSAYEARLSLIICNPSEFVGDHVAYFGEKSDAV